VSVASAGIDNKYGHPREECVMALREAGSEFWCTKDVGDVEVRPGKEDVEVRLQR
jgi:competence protein ComEC